MKKLALCVLLQTIFMPIYASDAHDNDLDQDITLLHPARMDYQDFNAASRLARIHDQLELLHGGLDEEYPEQLMAVRYVYPDAKVLELGGNFGRNSCVIGTCLRNSHNLVVCEPDSDAFRRLRENRDHNHLNFHIVNGTISKRRLIQTGGCSRPSDIDLQGFYQINTMTFDELQQEYDIQFDTLVADCEGALYYILMDDPSILQNIKLIIVENDYLEFHQFQEIVGLFRQQGFKLVYNKALGFNFGAMNYFYQVWKKGDENSNDN